MKSVVWPALINNVANVSLSFGSLGYWTACNNFKRYCTLPTVIFKPWVWTQFDAVVVYCSFLIPEKWRPLVDNTKLYLFVCVCVYIYIYKNRHIGSSAAEVAVKFQSARTILHTNLTDSRLHQILHCEVSKPCDLNVELSDCSEIWQPSRQHRCRCACQISKRCDNLYYQSRGFKTSRDLTVRRIRYWNGARIPIRSRLLTGGWFPLKSANSASTPAHGIRLATGIFWW